MSIFDTLKAAAEAELATLKADAQSVEAKVENAFHLGVLQSSLSTLSTAKTSALAKVEADFASAEAVLKADFAKVKAAL